MQKSGVLEALANALEKEGIKHTLHTGIASEPTTEIVDEAVRVGKKLGVDAVIGIGGGSVMDTAKAAAGVITNGGSVGNGRNMPAHRKLYGKAGEFFLRRNVAVPYSACGEST